LAKAPTTTAPPANSLTCGAPTSASSDSSIDTDSTAGATSDASAGIDPSAARAEAVDAAQTAIADPTVPGTVGDVPLVVTSVDADGHPDIHTLTASSVTNASNQAAKLTDKVGDDGGQVLAVEPEHTMTAAVMASDPGRSSQWALNTTDFENVWNTTSGSGECVAVLDTGIDLAHPDLAGRVAATDDLTGQGVNDGYGHGTHVAGIIAADANNGIGVAGAAPGVSLLAVKVLQNNGVGNSSWTSAGIIWAVDHGAKVINLSLGASCPPSAPAGCNTTDMQTALNYAQANDVMVIAAAGNDGDPTSAHYGNWSWPAADDWPIAVAATTENNQHATFSTQGSYVDVAAPGNDILSTMAPNSVLGGPTDNYEELSGTSMATPFVTAEAALLRAAYPSESAIQIRARIVGHVTDLGTPGPDPAFGAGLIDPAAALAG
jgi:subtilisin family serine protease